MQVKSIAECYKGEHSAILLTFIKLPFAQIPMFYLFLSGSSRKVLLFVHAKTQLARVGLSQQKVDLSTPMDTLSICK